MKGSARSCELLLHRYRPYATLRVPLDINATVKPAAGPSYPFSHCYILTRQILLLIGIIGLVSSPMRGAWLSLTRTGHKAVTEPLRAARLAQGKQDAEFASTGERQNVINMFKLATREDVGKARLKTMEERVQTVLRDGGAGTLMTEKQEDKENDAPDIYLAPPRASMSENQQEVISTTAMDVGEEEARFQKDLEEAIAASTQVSPDAERAPNAEDEERFEREMKMAMELSLKEDEEFERGLMQDGAEKMERG